MMRYSSLAGIVVLAIVLAVPVANAQVVGSSHDLSTSSGPGATSNVDRVCVFCHTPHQAAAASGQLPLWNHTLSSVASYRTYSDTNSSTFDANDTGNLGSAAVVGSASVTQLCLSCHDGTVSVASLYNAPNELGNVAPAITGGTTAVGTDGLLNAGTAALSTDLGDDHPVDIDYNAALAAKDGELIDPTDTGNTANGLLFADATSGELTVQCASCHDPHDQTYEPFMVMDNTGSALCLSCHIK